MPPESQIFVACVLAAYAVFIVTLAWAHARARGPAAE
jgi:hypothetical protein